MNLETAEQQFSELGPPGVSAEIRSSIASMYRGAITPKRIPFLNRAPTPTQDGPENWQWISGRHFLRRLLSEKEPFGWTHYRKVEPTRAALTALRFDPENEEFYLSNELRGELLWLLVNSLSPTRVIEYGTGRGFGSLSIAHSLKSLHSEGTITDPRLDTLDRLSIDTEQVWPREVQSKTIQAPAKLREIWDGMNAPESQLVRFLTGESLKCYPPIAGPYDFAFIDAGHDFLSVWSDLTSLALSNRNAPKAPSILFDDLGGKVGAGVVKAISIFLLPFIDPREVTVISMPISEAERRQVGYHAMMFLDARRCGPALLRAFDNLTRPAMIRQLYAAKSAYAVARRTLGPIKRILSRRSQ